MSTENTPQVASLAIVAFLMLAALGAWITILSLGGMGVHFGFVPIFGLFVAGRLAVYSSGLGN